MATLEVILPVLMKLQANLGGDVSLQALAAIAGLSPFHFHRVFRESVGETVKDYTLRLRLERAAFRLLLHDEKVLDVALDCGFQNHETFTRAFRRRFGLTPSDYRSRHAGWRAKANVRSREILGDPARGFELSEPKIVCMRETHLAFIRHTGPYETVSEKLWDDLTAGPSVTRSQARWPSSESATTPRRRLPLRGCASTPPFACPAASLQRVASRTRFWPAGLSP